MEVSDIEIEALYHKLLSEAAEGGYHLNPDVEFTKDLIRGLLVNEKRYGYQACPCRIASGKKELDLDIICPCDYRDADLSDFGTCYCGLYVSEDIVKGIKKLSSIPERRPLSSERRETKPTNIEITKLPFPIWRCKVCGYLCARESPPEICPICKAKKERFERFI
ncbi:MAG: ferredoxin-thioredoxin reductase catalytic domain-containing protein [candidate division WOR-3 bacterium]